MVVTCKVLNGVPAAIIGVIAHAICAWQTTRGAETATYVKAFVTQTFAFSPDAEFRAHRVDRRLPRQRLIVTQPGN
jgi:RecA/RadA recombinase